MSYGKKAPSGLADPKYQASLATLFYLRGLNHTDHFMCASDLDGIGPFGDFVILYREDQHVTACFIQILQYSYSDDRGISIVYENIVQYFLSFRKILNSLAWLEELFGEEIHDVEIMCYTDEILDVKSSYSMADHILDGGGLVHGFPAGPRQWELFEELKKFWEFLVDLSYDITEETNVMSLEESVDLFKSVVGSEEIISRVENLKNNLTRAGVDMLMAEIGGVLVKTEFKEFLEKFKIFHSQANIVKLMELVKDDFLKVCGVQFVGQNIRNNSDEEILTNSLNEIFAKFVEDIFEWVKKGEEWISRYSRIWSNVVHDVVFTVCEPAFKTVSECDAQFTQEALETLSEPILENRIVCIDAQSSHTVLNLVKVKEVLQGLEFFLLDITQLVKHKSIVFKAIERFWCSIVVIDTSDAVINDLSDIVKQFSQLLDLNKDTRLIFIAQDANEVLLPSLQTQSLKYERIIDIVSWVSMTQEFQTSFLNKTVLFQGVEMTLGALLAPYPEIFKEFHGHFLYSLLLSQEFIIGSNLPVVEEYVPRSLTRAVTFNPTILRSKFSNTLILVTGSSSSDIIEFIPEGENYHIFNPDEDRMETFEGIHIVVLEEETHEELFTNIISDGNMSAHCFTYSDNKLTWKWSIGDMNPLEPHIIKEKSERFQFEINLSTEKVCVIVGEREVGKTTFLARLAHDTKLSHPNNWLICFNPSNHEEFLNSTRLDDPETLYPLLKGVASYPHHSALSDMLFYHFWLTGNIIIFIDGFEHAQRCLIGETVNMINELKSNMKHLFVTCQVKNKAALCEGLCTIPFILQPVDTTDQRQYLSRKWRNKIVDENRLSVFVEAILSLLRNSISDEDKKLCSPPLLTAIVATAYSAELRAFAQSGSPGVPHKLNIVHLYEKFVEVQCYELLVSRTEDRNFTQHMLIENRTKLIDTYKLLALMLVLPKSDLRLIDEPSAQHDNSKDLNRLKQIVGPGCLVTFVDDTPEFLHKTLSEYFLGMWMADSYSFARRFIEDRFLEARYAKARLWMDRALCTSHELHCAAVAADETATAELLSKGVEINAFDSGGRTALHLAALHDHPRIVRLLLMAGADPSLADLVLGWRPLKYTDRLRAWASMNLLLETSVGKSLKADMAFTNKMLENDPMLNALLLTACERGFIHIMEYLHSQGVDVRKVIDFEGSTALHVAAESGQTETVKYLLCRELEADASANLCHNVLRILKLQGRGKAEANVARNDGSTAVLLAAQEGHADTLKVLLDSGATVDQRKLNGSTAMHAAVAENHTEVVRVLLDAGAGPNGDDGEGTAPLHAAAAEGHAGLVRLLLEYGSEPTAVDRSNATPLHWAAAGGHLRCAEALVRAGAGVNAKDEDLRTPLHWAAIEGQSALVRFLLLRGAEPKMVARDGGTAVHYAARENRPGTLLTFTRQGVDINLISPDGSTPLHWASHRGNDPAVQHLLQMGANRDAANYEGYTPLHVAARRGHTSLVRLFLRAGAPPDGGGTARRAPPLHLAAKGEHAACVRALLEAHAGADTADAVGATALHWAAWCGHDETLTLLLRAGADPTIADNHRSTPLHWAAGSGHHQAVEALLRAGSLHSATNRDGETPLHWAAREGHTDVVRSLLAAGADPLVRSRDGDIPANLAARAQHSELLSILEGASVKLPSERFYDVTAEESVRNEYDTPEGTERKNPMELRKMSTIQVMGDDTFYDTIPRGSNIYNKKGFSSWDDDDKRKVSLIRMSVGVYEHEETVDDLPQVHRNPIPTQVVVRPTNLPLAMEVSRVRVDSEKSYVSAQSNDDYSSLLSDESTRAVTNDSDTSEGVCMTPVSNDILLPTENEEVPPPLPTSPMPRSPVSPTGRVFDSVFGAGASIVRYARKAIGSDSLDALMLSTASSPVPERSRTAGLKSDYGKQTILETMPSPEEGRIFNGLTADFLAAEGLTTIKPNTKGELRDSHAENNTYSYVRNGQTKSSNVSMKNSYSETPSASDSEEDLLSGLAAAVHTVKKLSLTDGNGNDLHQNDPTKDGIIQVSDKNITNALQANPLSENIKIHDADDSDASC